MERRRRVFGSACLGLLAAVAVAAQGADDRVILRKGSPIQGQVQKDAETVSVRHKQGGEMAQPATEVVEIIWDIADFNWTNGLSDMNAGKFSDACHALSKVLPNLKNPALFRLEAEAEFRYRYGECLFQTGQLAEAAEQFRTFIRGFQGNRFRGRSLERLALAYIQLGKTKEAKESLNAVRSLGGDAAVRAALLEGDLNLRLRQANEAEACYTQAAGLAPDGSELRLLANMGQAKVAFLAKRFDKAKEMAEKALKGRPTANAAAAAHLILGNIYFEEAAKLTDQAKMQIKLLDAALEFLRVHLLYAGDERTEPEALYKAGETFRLLMRLPGQQASRERAKDMFSKVRERYPSSPLAPEAEKRLDEMR
jgi:tetratricopeptide (TPR) repeat protein